MTSLKKSNLPNKIEVDIVTVYTDGSCIKIKGKSQCGYGIYFPNKEIKDVSKRFTKTPLTNQRSELYAIYKALKKIIKNIKFKQIYIYSDSEYSIKSLTEWIDNWKKNGWKTANKKEVLNQDIIKKIDKKLQKYKGMIIFTHVKAHTEKKDKHSLGNAQADRLATEGARK
jgi:ribonuclease HI